MKKTRFGQKRAITFCFAVVLCILLTGCTSKNTTENGTENGTLLSATAAPSITEGAEIMPADENGFEETPDIAPDSTRTQDGASDREETDEGNTDTEEIEEEGTKQDNTHGKDEQQTALQLNENKNSIEELAKREVAKMTLEEKVGQMFFVRYQKDTALADIEQYHVSGFILFGADFADESVESITKQIEKLRAASSYPLLIGVDEEGGTVNRVSRYTAFRDTPFLSPQQLYRKGGFDLIVSDTIEKAKLLLELGINMNLAPVCDVTSSADDYMYARSFGKDAEETALYAETVVSTMKEQGIFSVLKHFPGYGNNGNTHTDICVDERPYETFLEEDFLPFRAGINAGADAVLVSHNIVTCIDSDMPASLSKHVHEILREELGFEGVIMTDDLVMEAITKYTDGMAAAVDAVKAGNDLLIASDYQVQIPAVLEAVQSGEIEEDTIDQAVIRVLIMKWKQNGIEQE